MVNSFLQKKKQNQKSIRWAKTVADRSQQIDPKVSMKKKLSSDEVHHDV